jgi:hypothetical protein
MKLFEAYLSAPLADIEFEFTGFSDAPWLDHLLNPRRLRGSDFLMRWSQGVWSEKRLIESINETDSFYALPYGPSGTAPTDDVRAFELYFERLDKAGLGKIKRPDLLIFNKKDLKLVDKIVNNFGGISELPFIKEKDLKKLLDEAIMAVECENSLWVAEKMPDFNSQLSPQKWLNGKMGLKKTAVLPTVIIKEEDRAPLLKWQKANKISIHIWHVFYDKAYGLSLNNAMRLLNKRLVLPTVQVFQAPGGATTKKTIYEFYYHYAYPLGTSTESPTLVSQYIEDKNGHILPYVRFEGGKLQILPEAIEVLKKCRKH